MKKIKRVLIANRGEIAVRIIRACKEMEIQTVAVFSDADTESLHVKLADQAIRIGPGPASDSYLRMDHVLDAAIRSQSDAVHPGYGLLSENAEFAQALQDKKIILIGPSPESIRMMGNKTAAREKMMAAKVPVVPGSPGPLQDAKEGIKLAKKIGYPVLIKAVSGGGGRGMRIVEEEGRFADAYDSAAREAQGAFGDGRLYLEKYLINPRHVEIQVMADQHGNCFHVGERECSVQRRHQKVIEETPCTVLSDEKRQEMGLCAVQSALAVNYRGAGTIEFLLDERGDFYFIEMNTRLQVEHPITEMVYNVDLVKTQIRVAQGEKLEWKQEALQPKGAAIECRICAEDPDKNFQPCPGEITGLRLPGGPGIRIDSCVYDGYEIPIYYDPMICKLIAWGENREIAISRMISALNEIQLSGIKTNISLLKEVLIHPQFVSGQYNINFLKDYPIHEKKKQDSVPEDELRKIAAIAATISTFQKRRAGIEAQKNAEKDKKSYNAWKYDGLRRMMEKI